MSEPNREPKSDASNRRAHYRVEYPVHDRPGFTAGALRGSVTDCSETGVRVLFPADLAQDATVLVGHRMSATIRFARGEVAEVEGEVVRYDGRNLSLRLDAAKLPFGLIIKEQWWLRARYPWRDGK
jgi:PilZ domain